MSSLLSLPLGPSDAPQGGRPCPCEASRPGYLHWAAAALTFYWVLAWVLIHLQAIPGLPAWADVPVLGWWMGVFGWLLSLPLHVPILAGLVRPLLHLHGPAAFWLLLLAATLYHLFFWGWWVRRAPWGFAISGRNVASLAQLQFLLWMGLAVATAGTAALYDLAARHPEVDWFADPSLLGALGISTGALVGAGTIVAVKKNALPDPTQLLPPAQKLARGYTREYAHDLARALAAEGPAQAKAKKADVRLATRGGAKEKTPGQASQALARALVVNAGIQMRTPRSSEAPGPTGQLVLQAEQALRQERGRQFKAMEALLPLIGGPENLANVLTHLHAGLEPEGALEMAGLRGVLDSLGTLHRVRAELAALGDVKGLLEDWVAHDLQEASASVVYANRCPCEARLGDLFQGDEVANTTQPDLGKMQFAAMSLIAFAVLAYNLLATLQAPPSLPPGAAREGTAVPVRGLLPDGLLTLAGASTAGYLGNKLPSFTKRQ